MRARIEFLTMTIMKLNAGKDEAFTRVRENLFARVQRKLNSPFRVEEMEHSHFFYVDENQGFYAGQNDAFYACQNDAFYAAKNQAFSSLQRRRDAEFSARASPSLASVAQAEAFYTLLLHKLWPQNFLFPA